MEEWFLKKFKIYLLLGMAVFLTWICFIICIDCLTIFHGTEFADLSTHNTPYLFDSNERPEIRVFWYSTEKATVYYVGKDGGEKVAFIKAGDRWIYKDTLAIWSSGGTADQCFIWPYYRNFVPQLLPY